MTRSSMIRYLDRLHQLRECANVLSDRLVGGFLNNPPLLRVEDHIPRALLDSRREPPCIYVSVQEPLELEGLGGGVPSVRILRWE